MCGIAGIVDYSGIQSEDISKLDIMMSSISHRGPDANGQYHDELAAICHVRLSIIDLSGGVQPMTNDSGSLILSFNGEIYNYKEIRKELESKGYHFNTDSDTEVVLRAFEEYGHQCFSHFNGMFAIAIWDKTTEKLTLARDRFGKKPLYYSVIGNRLVFSSELKSLSRSLSIQQNINHHSVSDYFSLGYISTPNTIYDGVQKLMPASYMVVARSGQTNECYWDLDFNNKTKDSYQDATRHVDSLLRKSVNDRLMSDVPFGAFLSGGIDSSLIVSYMQQEMSEPVHTFSIGFDEDKFSELNEARNISDFLGTDHTEYVIESNCTDIVDEFIGFYDEPFGDSSSLPTFFVSKLAADKVKMVLTGDGGDECFGGYKRYSRFLISKMINNVTPDSALLNQLISSLPGKYAKKVASILKRAHSGFPYSYINEVKLNNLEGISEFLNVPSSYNPLENISEYFTKYDNDLDNIYYGDIKSYMLDDILVKVDRMSMANSIEVRSPLLDYRLMEYSASLPGHYKTGFFKGKHILRDLANKYLPAAVSKGKKKGFAIPLDLWFRKELGDMLLDLLSSKNSVCSDIYDRQYVERLLTMHRAKQGNYGEMLWLFLCFERWSYEYNS